MTDMDDEAHADIAFSRSAGLLAQTGNADAADDFRRLARGLGMNTSELLRHLVLIRHYGKDGVAMMAARQLDAVAGDGPERAQA